VRTNTVVGPGGDASVLRLKGTGRLLALSTDCNPRLCYLDPAEGARAAVAEACRNVVCTGGTPLAATNCLNFASPENPETMWQFAETIEGIRSACEAFGTPITGGNVSFYNETRGTGIYPTPVIGMVGIVERMEYVTPSAFQATGDRVLLVGPNQADAVRLAGSEYLELFCGRVAGTPVPVDLDLEKRVQAFVADMIRRGWIRSAHDCSEGGLVPTVVESCLNAEPRLGAELRLAAPGDAHRTLFGEGPSRVVISVSEETLTAILNEAKARRVPLEIIGRVAAGDVRVVYNGEELLSATIDEIFAAWDRALELRLHPEAFAGKGNAK
jgi:phosphoribosylformylglycinamidine (FGAM) synthase-like enzyme